MRKLVYLFFLLLSRESFAQIDTGQWVRAFPITGYITPLADSVNIVQLHLPNGPVLQLKQSGLLRGIYQHHTNDTMLIGFGKLHLVKGDYYYFSVTGKANGPSPKEGSLLYTLVNRSAVYNGRLVSIASHLIVLQSVYEDPLYDIDQVFAKWTAENEKQVIDSIVSDIRFTGEYFTKNDASQDRAIGSGSYKGKKIFTVMRLCSTKDVNSFLDYIIARPRLYAGRKWKISELFATWLSEGAPEVAN